jgi:epoxyqueuosine reductase
MTAAERVKSRARELGFTLVGIAPATAMREETTRLREWLARGYHATMRWMAQREEKRTDPRAVVPGAWSVVSVGMNYYTPVRHASDPAIGKISRYAWGEDYHEILGARLQQLQDWMEGEFPGSKNLWYVDTGPVMEKAWAQRAGIGWIGKHTNVINQERGSWLFLGEIITTVQLEPDSPATDHCGTCTLCIKACPTKAIVEPYVVDAGRCISYLTIEHRGPIPDELAARFENWIFGCDICQDVCPWNHRFSGATAEPGFLPRPGNEAPVLQDWRKITEEEFGPRFRGSPVRRSRWAGLLRNIRAVVSGNSGAPGGP